MVEDAVGLVLGDGVGVEVTDELAAREGGVGGEMTLEVFFQGLEADVGKVERGRGLGGEAGSGLQQLGIHAVGDVGDVDVAQTGVPPSIRLSCSLVICPHLASQLGHEGAEAGKADAVAVGQEAEDCILQGQEGGWEVGGQRGVATTHGALYIGETGDLVAAIDAGMIGGLCVGG